VSTKRDDLPIVSPPTVTLQNGGAPPYPAVSLPDIDARTHALRALGRWCASLRYMRTMRAPNPAQPFYIDLDRIFVEMPDAVEKLDFPAIAFLPGRGQYVTRGLGPAAIVESTEGIAGTGTALLIPYDYQETFIVEGWGSKISERRSIVAAIETAIATYIGTTDLRLVLPDYFDQVATFTIVERENIDDLEVPRGRRRVHLFLQLTVPVVRLGRWPSLVGPFVDLTVGSGAASPEAAALVGAKGALGVASVEAKIAASSAAGGALGLRIFGLSVTDAQAIARATLGLTVAESTALTEAYLLALVQSLAGQAAGFETSLGRPPYSPQSNPAQVLLDDLRWPASS
jgi:hypothetical protein